MLVLTRRTMESLRIGEEVTVTILGVKGHQVRIGVSAPRSIVVHRAEVYERIRRAGAADPTPRQEVERTLATL